MSEDLSPEEKEDARRIFRGEVNDRSACWHCGGLHETVARIPAWRQPCPRIKRVTRDNDGYPIEVEYWPAHSPWERGIVFPDQVFDDVDE